MNESPNSLTFKFISKSIEKATSSQSLARCVFVWICGSYYLSISRYVIMQGYVILAQALAEQKVKHCYGIVGVPVIELGFAIQAMGVNYYGFRNEQQASYAAGYTGYLTGIPGACLCVSGPGHTNAISGVANAWANCWPMILISGSNDLNQTSRQAFQEIDQVYFVKPYTKYSVRITDPKEIPYHVHKAVRASITGRPGPVFLDLPGDVLTATVQTPIEFPLFVPPSKYGPDPAQLEKAVALLPRFKKPLIIVGKGCAYGHAEKEVRELVQKTGIPFLPTPMGKGVVPDSHALNISAARSTALAEADLIILLGARLNWILHFGLPNRFSKDVKIIQADICPQEMGHNVEASARLIGDLQMTLSQLNKRLPGKVECQQWITKLHKKCQKNKKANEQLMADPVVPMTYYSSYSVIKDYIPKDTILIGEGANTMDVGRTVFQHDFPRRKLDAATFGTMGIGLPAVISARTTHPQLWAVSVMGDSAFGFSGMECQTITRYKMGAVIFIINNNGIYSGTDKLEGEPSTYGVTHLNPETKYEHLACAFGGKGLEAKNKDDLHRICKEIFGNPENKTKLFLVNVRIQPSSAKKPQENSWLTRSSPAPKL